MPRGGAREGAGRKPGVKAPATKKKWSGYLPIYIVKWLAENGIDEKGKSQAALIERALIKTYKIKKPKTLAE